MNTPKPNRPAADPPRLFDEPEPDAAEAPPPLPTAGRGTPRISRAQRSHIISRAAPLDALIPEDHPARIVRAYRTGLDLAESYDRVRAIEGRPGRAPIDPKILPASWPHATIEGIGTARRLDELCRDHVAYRWIAGEVPTNYHTPADSRVDHVGLLQRLLTLGVAAPLAEGLVTLSRVAQDGMRVRADAGAASSRRRPTPERAPGQAEAQLAALPAETVGSDAGQMTPMVDRIVEGPGVKPKGYLADGGLASHAEAAAMGDPGRDVLVDMPVPERKHAARGPHEARDSDSAAVAAWRARMATAEAKEISRDRAAPAGCVNALARQRGPVRSRVRGRVQALAVALWHALGHNLMGSVSLRAPAGPRAAVAEAA